MQFVTFFLEKCFFYKKPVKKMKRVLINPKDCQSKCKNEYGKDGYNHYLPTDDCMCVCDEANYLNLFTTLKSKHLPYYFYSLINWEICMYFLLWVFFVPDKCIFYLPSKTKSFEILLNKEGCSKGCVQHYGKKGKSYDLEPEGCVCICNEINYIQVLIEITQEDSSVIKYKKMKRGW